MEKYNEFIAKATAIKDVGEFICGRKKGLAENIGWQEESRNEYLAECKEKETEPSDWRMQSYEDDIANYQFQIKALERIEKLLEKEMGA